jgi:hypothetical protein
MERWFETVDREAANWEVVDSEVVHRVAVDWQGGTTGPETQSLVNSQLWECDQG